MRWPRAVRTDKPELTLRGVSAAPGIVSAKAVVLERSWLPGTTVINPRHRAAEMDRARDALGAVARELEQIAGELRQSGRRHEADIVETGVLMANDPGLLARLEALVMDSGRSSPDALREATEESARELAQLPDPLLAERADDVRSLGRRAAARAMAPAGVMQERRSWAEGVIVAGTLGPADVAELAANAKGVALAGGGVTAHAAIVARSLGLPMVIGLGPELLRVEDGEVVVLDGDEGVLIRHPDATRLAAALEEEQRRSDARRSAVANRLMPAQTRDGHRVSVLANAASVAEVIEALAQGAEGVGLVRTELLFLEAAAWPSRDQQASFLKEILAPLSGRIATVRLLDFGGDKTPPFLRGETGRGVELLRQHPEALTDQLAAIVDAGVDVRLRVLIPMVSGAEQVQQVRRTLELVLDGSPAPLVGAMIETPEAAAEVTEIARHADFLSIGTNDLTQLVLGLDREKSKSAPVTETKVLRLIDASMRAARAAGIPVDVCGEAASDFEAMPVMVGLGADELSVAAARVGDVRQRVRDLDFSACREASEKRLLDEPGHAGRKRR